MVAWLGPDPLVIEDLKRSRSDADAREVVTAPNRTPPTRP